MTILIAAVISFLFVYYGLLFSYDKDSPFNKKGNTDIKKL